MRNMRIRVRTSYRITVRKNIYKIYFRKRWISKEVDIGPRPHEHKEVDIDPRPKYRFVKKILFSLERNVT